MTDPCPSCVSLRETVKRLNRRVTKAEGIVMAKVKDERRAGRSLGRALANAACSALEARVAELEAEVELVRGMNNSLWKRLAKVEDSNR